MKNTIVIMVLFFATGCATAQQGTKPPKAKQAIFKESYSPTEISVLATGIGNHVDEAELDAQYSAVYFILTMGTDPMLQTNDEKKKFEAIADKFFTAENIKPYIAFMGNDIISRIKTADGLKIQKLVRVNRERLSQDLMAKSILTTKEELKQAGGGNPFLMVIPEVGKKENPITALENPNLKKASQVIESYLSARKYDVVVPQQQQAMAELTEAQTTTKGIEPDISYQMALSVGADVYITYTVEIAKTNFGSKGVVGCRAYETTTAKLLGTETGYSPERPSVPNAVLIEEAMNDAIEKVLSRINAYWKEELTRGSQYKLIFKVLTKVDDSYELYDKLDDFLKPITTAKKRMIETDNTAEYVVWQNKFESASKMFSALKKSVDTDGSFKIKRINVNKKLMIIGIESM